jgi:hypothetical protein
MHMSQSLFFLKLLYIIRASLPPIFKSTKTAVTTASGHRYTILLSAAIVEELEHFMNLINVRNVTHIKIILKFINTINKLHQFQLYHDSSRQQYGVTVTRCCSYSCFVLLNMSDSDARNM